MQIFPDTSPEKPVHLRCACGRSITLVAPPETWPVPCPVCSRPVQAVDPSTVRDPSGEEMGLLAAPSVTGVPAVRGSGLPVPVKMAFRKRAVMSFSARESRSG